MFPYSFEGRRGKVSDRRKRPETEEVGTLNSRQGNFNNLSTEFISRHVTNVQELKGRYINVSETYGQNYPGVDVMITIFCDF
jgi:hypothetical protein